MPTSQVILAMVVSLAIVAHLVGTRHKLIFFNNSFYLWHCKQLLMGKPRLPARGWLPAEWFCQRVVAARGVVAHGGWLPGGGFPGDGCPGWFHGGGCPGVVSRGVAAHRGWLPEGSSPGVATLHQDIQYVDCLMIT